MMTYSSSIKQMAINIKLEQLVYVKRLGRMKNFGNWEKKRCGAIRISILGERPFYKWIVCSEMRFQKANHWAELGEISSSKFSYFYFQRSLARKISRRHSQLPSYCPICSNISRQLQYLLPLRIYQRNGALWCDKRNR